MSHCLETVFSGCAETGTIPNSILKPSLMKAALKSVDYVEHFPAGSDKDYHDIRVPLRAGTVAIYPLPTLTKLLKENMLFALDGESKLMRMGFKLVAEAIREQRANPENASNVGSILITAGHAIASSFQVLSEKSRNRILYDIEGPSLIARRPTHQLPNYMRYPEGEAIAKKLFEAGLHYNN